MGNADSLMETAQHLDLALISGLRRDQPLLLSWPMDGIPAGWLSIQTPQGWREFVASLSLPRASPKSSARNIAGCRCFTFWPGSIPTSSRPANW